MGFDMQTQVLSLLPGLREMTDSLWQAGNRSRGTLAFILTSRNLPRDQIELDRVSGPAIWGWGAMGAPRT